MKLPLESILKAWYFLIFWHQIEEFEARKREGAKPTPPFSEASQKSEVAENEQ